MTELVVYRGTPSSPSEVTRFNIDETTVLVKKLLNASAITASFVSETVLPLSIGDWVLYDSNYYYINKPHTVDKQNEKTYKYTIVFNGVLYNLNKKLLISSDGLLEFSYTGTATQFLQLIISAITTIDSGWTAGEVDDTGLKTITFSNDTCRTALTKIRTAFGFEFDNTGKTINLKEAVGNITDHTFKYGRNQGLYNVVRKSTNNNSLATKVYGFGGAKNIPYTYRNHAKRLVFEELYLEKNTDVYGVVEGVFVDETIYPQRTSTVTDTSTVILDGQFDGSNSYIEDSTIDFDINDHLVEGLTAKIVFKSGALEGSEFEIWKYDHETKRIYINSFTEGDGFTLPNETRTVAVGDSYTLVNIDMPQIYIIEAEAALKTATQKFLDANCVPKSLYIVKIDPKYAKLNNIKLNAGDLVKITDERLGIDRAIRVAQVTEPLVNPHKITAIIADFIPYTLQEQVAENALLFNSKVSSIVNNAITNNVNNNSTTNNISSTTVINEGNVNKILINSRLFSWEKGFDNKSEDLQIGDVIFDNYWSRYLFVKKWKYLGGIKELRSSWDEIETLDETPITA